MASDLFFWIPVELFSSILCPNDDAVTGLIYVNRGDRCQSLFSAIPAPAGKNGKTCRSTGHRIEDPPNGPYARRISEPVFFSNIVPLSLYGEKRFPRSIFYRGKNRIASERNPIRRQPFGREQRNRAHRDPRSPDDCYSSMPGPPGKPL